MFNEYAASAFFIDLKFLLNFNVENIKKVQVFDDLRKVASMLHLEVNSQRPILHQLYGLWSIFLKIFQDLNS